MTDPMLFSANFAQQLSSDKATPRISGVRTEAEAERVAQEFESFLLSQMVSSMFSGIEGGGGMFGGGPGEKAFSGMLHEEYAKVFASQGGIGLADDLKLEILRMQGIETSGETK